MLEAHTYLPLVIQSFEFVINFRSEGSYFNNSIFCAVLRADRRSLKMPRLMTRYRLQAPETEVDGGVQRSDRFQSVKLREEALVIFVGAVVECSSAGDGLLWENAWLYEVHPPCFCVTRGIHMKL